MRNVDNPLQLYTFLSSLLWCNVVCIIRISEEPIFSRYPNVELEAAGDDLQDYTVMQYLLPSPRKPQFLHLFLKFSLHLN
jgi:hypothetical protein